MCPAQVYEVEPGDGEQVEVRVTPSNCVQCGAITAKGGRLTPPEGGSGPEYTRSSTAGAALVGRRGRSLPLHFCHGAWHRSRPSET